MVTNFSEKADPLTSFLQINVHSLNKLAPLYLKTEKKLRNLSITENDMSTNISNLDPKKSHGLDNLSVICDSLIFPLNCIFEGAL